MDTAGLMREFWSIAAEIDSTYEFSLADAQRWVERLSHAAGAEPFTVSEACEPMIKSLFVEIDECPAHDPSVDTWNSRTDFFALVCQLQIEWGRNHVVDATVGNVNCLMTWLLCIAACQRFEMPFPLVEDYVYFETRRARPYCGFLNQCVEIYPRLAEELWSRYQNRETTSPPDVDDPYDELVRLGIVVSAAIRLARMKAAA